MSASTIIQNRGGTNITIKVYTNEITKTLVEDRVLASGDVIVLNAIPPVTLDQIDSTADLVSYRVPRRVDSQFPPLKSPAATVGSASLQNLIRKYDAGAEAYGNANAGLAALGSDVVLLAATTPAATRQQPYNVDRGPLAMYGGALSGDFTFQSLVKDYGGGMVVGSAAGEQAIGLIVMSDRDPNHFAWIGIILSDDPAYYGIPTYTGPTGYERFVQMHWQKGIDLTNADFAATSRTTMSTGNESGTEDWEDTASLRSNNENAVQVFHDRSQTSVGSEEAANLRIVRDGASLELGFDVDATTFAASTRLKMDNFIEGPVRVGMLVANGSGAAGLVGGRFSNIALT